MAPSPERARRVPAIIVHGGAGASPADRADLREGMRAAVEAGWRALAAGATTHDHPRFNAGRGSVLTEDGHVQMDASIMEGDRLACGAVAAVERVPNPVTLARRVLEDGRHVLLVGEGAETFARTVGIPACDPESLVTERQRRRLAERLAATPTGTVGAVALDRHGTAAAATSTGGTMGKRRGRVGDSALIGAGTYADSTQGAVSCTGDGEAIIRVVLARRALEYLKEAGDVDYASHVAVDLLVEEGRGEGGLILVDWRGRTGYAHSTPFMPVAWMSPSAGAPVVPF
jgi:beta-aspartyl-peptidase (threonine type)